MNEMPPSGQAAIREEDLGLLRLRTLVRLRWLAVIGQTGAVLGVYYLLGFPLPLGLCLAVIALSAWLNIFLSLRWRKSVRLKPSHAGLLLGYDVIQLAVLLYLTGGLENPFAFLFLVPVTDFGHVPAAQMDPVARERSPSSAPPSSLSSTCRCRGMPAAPLVLPQAYIAGMWAAIVCGVVFSAIYARRIAEEARQMSAALSATEMVLAREQRLSALDGLAAAAAHELGTPLATIALVAKELKRELPPDGPHTEDIDLLISQAGRCREILSRLANREAETDEIYQRTKLVGDDRGPGCTPARLRCRNLRRCRCRRWRRRRPNRCSGAIRPSPMASAIFWRMPSTSPKARSASRRAGPRRTCRSRWATTGPASTRTIFDRLGDPFVTTRRGYGADDEAMRARHEGMGLGFFIAKTLLERSGRRGLAGQPSATRPWRGGPGRLAARRRRCRQGLSPSNACH